MTETPTCPPLSGAVDLDVLHERIAAGMRPEDAVTEATTSNAPQSADVQAGNVGAPTDGADALKSDPASEAEAKPARTRS